MDEKTLQFPCLGNVASTQTYVIIGANGSGKTHLGAWIEKHNDNVLRISAQRALSIPKRITIESEEVAWNKIYYGDPSSLDKGYKWKFGEETSALVNDYQSVLSIVFSTESDELREYKKRCDGGDRPDHFETVVDKIIKVWKEVFPQREIVLEKFQANAKHEGVQYRAGAMSDGERVGLYMIAQCLITPDDYTIIIDEPEIHLHTSIMKRLWDEIEKYCPNKTFVYITHDLRFATSRKTATKIWVQEYDGASLWKLDIIEENEEIPETLLLEVLGTRRPVLFVEGGKSSFDLALYKEIYSDYHVVGCSNCQKVIELTKAFNNENVKSLHAIEVKGLIDHDFLSNEEIKSYEKKNIYATGVLEVENLFLIEPLIRLSARQLGNDPDEVFKSVSENMFELMDKKKQDIIKAITVKEIRHRLNGFTSEGKDKNDIKNDFDNLVAGIDTEDIYNKAESAVTEIIRTKDYEGLLRTFNHKGLSSIVRSKIMITKSYTSFILDLMKGEKRVEIINALRAYLPDLNNPLHT